MHPYRAFQIVAAAVDGHGDYDVDKVLDACQVLAWQEQAFLMSMPGRYSRFVEQMLNS
jgi:hypothetical protein